MATTRYDVARVYKSERGADEDFNDVRFLTEVEAQFKSETIIEEVRWRLEVLNEIASQPGLDDASEVLRDKLTQIFTGGGDENAVLGRLKELTDVQNAEGETLSLRSFLKRERRSFSERDYRGVLDKKISNTHAHVVNLIAYYPEAESELHKLSATLKGLAGKLKDSDLRTASVKKMEDRTRETPAFALYEDLKSRFLKDWLKRFANLSESEIADLDPGEVQRLIREHQRHQMTRLLKTKIKMLETDMTSQLGMHDTLEGEFKDQGFWKGANVAGKSAFNDWVLTVVRAFGMLRGQRYAFFQSEDNQEQYLLFGLGLSHLPEVSSDPIRMVPYIKPFTRKGTYLLEIRKREIGDSEQYYHELLHYTLPFLFAFDQMKEFQIRNELTTFFTTKY